MREILLDTETTGLDPIQGHKIVEIGCVELIHKVKTGKVFHCYINPERDMPEEAYRVHGLSYEFLADKKIFKHIAEEFLEFISGAKLVIHNARFDVKFLNHELKQHSLSPISFENVIDTLDLARRKFPGSPASLDALCKRFKIDSTKRTKHGALLDAELLAEVYIHLTGGNQPSMNLQAQSLEKAQSTIIIEKTFKEARPFSLTAQEEEEHNKFIQKIKNNLWNKQG